MEMGKIVRMGHRHPNRDGGPRIVGDQSANLLRGHLMEIDDSVFRTAMVRNCSCVAKSVPAANDPLLLAARSGRVNVRRMPCEPRHRPRSHQIAPERASGPPVAGVTPRAAVSCSGVMPVRRKSALWLALAVVASLLGGPTTADAAEPPVERTTESVLPGAVEQFRWFHANPELSGEEKQTAAHLAQQLRELGLEVTEGIGGHGIVGVLRNGKGPVVLYRADMDGLPVTEATGVAYASKNPGVMHACGHDVHMATAVGTIESLAAMKDAWSGTLLFVGQPAEETGRGARAMLDDPQFRKILSKVGRPDVALALHDAADLPAGHVSLIPGFHHANVDSVDIVVHGKGGHGARPHEAIDPIVIGSEIVLALQTIVSRRIRPDEKAVVTVGKFDAGTKHNIIPPSATLLLTVRSYSDETRKTLLTEIERIARQVAKVHRAPRAPDVNVRTSFVPAAYNDEAWTAEIKARFVELLGADKVHEHAPSLGGEDFGLFPRELKIPGVMYKLGAVNPRTWKRAELEDLPGLHSDRWVADPEPTLRTGISTMTAAILEAFEGLPKSSR